MYREDDDIPMSLANFLIFGRSEYFVWIGVVESAYDELKIIQKGLYPQGYEHDLLLIGPTGRRPGLQKSRMEKVDSMCAGWETISKVDL